MLRTFTALRQHILTKRKSPKVADETMFRTGDGVIYAPEIRRGRHAWNGFSVVCTIVSIPFSLLSCFCHHHGNGADGLWVTGGERVRTSEIDHLMVSDSMRYAILM